MLKLYFSRTVVKSMLFSDSTDEAQCRSEIEAGYSNLFPESIPFVINPYKRMPMQLLQVSQLRKLEASGIEVIDDAAAESIATAYQAANA